jgi:SAM-dependent methyltransferase
MADIACRACRGTSGELVLDLGAQPACDYFPAADDPGPDPAYPLQMWLCATCGLAQLVADPTVPEEPKGAEPAALVAQARDAVGRVDAAGWLRAGARVVEYGSPHGGSWLDLLTADGLSPAPDGLSADVILDCFGLMHCADQAAAIAERAARLAPGGVLLIQYHSLATIIERGQWNSLRHGHFAYYSATSLAALLAPVGLALRSAWSFELYGGTVLLAVTRAEDGDPDESVAALLAGEQRVGVRDPQMLRALQTSASASAEAVHAWLSAAKGRGARVLGYGAASRAVALLCRAGVGSDLLPAIADASPAKQDTRMPATDIKVISPQRLADERPDEVLLLLPDLLTEVRAALPGIEAAGGRWVDVETIGTMAQTEESITT